MQVKYNNSAFHRFFFFSLKFVGTVFVSLSYDCITSSRIIAESSITLPKYFPFSQPHVEGFQI